MQVDPGDILAFNNRV